MGCCSSATSGSLAPANRLYEEGSDEAHENMVAREVPNSIDTWNVSVAAHSTAAASSSSAFVPVNQNTKARTESKGRTADPQDKFELKEEFPRHVVDPELQLSYNASNKAREGTDTRKSKSEPRMERQEKQQSDQPRNSKREKESKLNEGGSCQDIQPGTGKMSAKAQGSENWNQPIGVSSSFIGEQKLSMEAAPMWELKEEGPTGGSERRYVAASDVSAFGVSESKAGFKVDFNAGTKREFKQQTSANTAAYTGYKEPKDVM